MIGGFYKDFVDYYCLQEEARNSLPSRFLKAYLDSDEYWDCFLSNRDKGWNSYPTWSSLQLLTIAYFFMSSRKRVRYIRSIAEEMKCSIEERTLLRMCAKELAKNKYRGKLSKKTHAYYKNHFSKKTIPILVDEPLFLPVLFKTGDVLCVRKGNGHLVYFIVINAPDNDTRPLNGFHLEEYAVLELKAGRKLLAELPDDEQYRYWTGVGFAYAEPVPDRAIPDRLRIIVERLREKGLFQKPAGNLISLEKEKDLVERFGFNVEVNRTIRKTPLGDIEVISPNSEGKLVLPKEWYDPEDDIYDEIYGPKDD